MNDRFKFRYWHTKENKYINTQCDCLAICNSCLQSIRDIPDVRGWYNTVLDQAYNDFELIPEQCTGLKDKNGNLIYEGDLIKSPNNSYPLAVYHDISGLWWCKENRPNGIWELPLYDMVRNYTVEIIGNIHEQAEQKE